MYKLLGGTKLSLERLRAKTSCAMKKRINETLALKKQLQAEVLSPFPPEALGVRSAWVGGAIACASCMADRAGLVHRLCSLRTHPRTLVLRSS